MRRGELFRGVATTALAGLLATAFGPACSSDDSCSSCVADSGARERLGGACTADADCPSGAFCLDSASTDLFGGSGPAGVCTADCTADPSICFGFLDALCIDVSPIEGTLPEGGTSTVRTSRCFETCALGSQSSSECHGLPDIACAPLQGVSSGFCRPLCTTDADCGTRHCDKKTGACVDWVTRADDTLGSTCNADAANASCSALCVDLGGGESVCSHRCIFGETSDCAEPADGTQTAGCIFATPGGSIGDVGYCAELCDCPSECANATAVCDPFSDASLETAFGRKGVCTPPSLALGTPIVCP